MKQALDLIGTLADLFIFAALTGMGIVALTYHNIFEACALLATASYWQR